MKVNNTRANQGRLGPLRRIAHIVRRTLRPDPIELFFNLPYEERVREVKRLYSPEMKRLQLGNWLARSPEVVEHELGSNIRFFMDVITGYAFSLSPLSIMQWGAFTMTEGQYLSRAGFSGRFIASDFDSDHLAYLEQNLTGLQFDEIEFRNVDLENACADDFCGTSMAVALAVLSNIQPEGIQRLFEAISNSEIKCVVIGDMYVKESLNPDPETARSVPYSHCRNWCHPYLALAAAYDLQAQFIPDFTYSSFLEARGIFVVHKGITNEIHAAAVAEAIQHYFSRQPKIWAEYAGFDLSKPQITAVHSDQNEPGAA
ncbi:MAG: hypothetical protein O2985_01470 [Proteobacteria bacterium]|nr:hypothetical protein [Pseudomonadota bacterium]